MSDRVFVMMIAPVGEKTWACAELPEELQAELVKFAESQTDSGDVVDDYNIKVKLVSREALDSLPEFEGW